jgi:hypothetical protein
MEQFTGTQPVREQHVFDVAALEAWLGPHLDGFRGPLEVSQFKGGQSNPTYLLRTPGASYVMRAKPGPVAKLLPSAHAVEREFRVMQALQGSAVPVPRMHAVRGRVDHRPRLLRDGVRARPRALGPSLPGLSNAERGADLRRDEPRDRRAAQRRRRRRRPGRLRQARQLLRPPDRPLEQAVPRLADRDHRRDGPAARLAAGTCAGQARDESRRSRWCMATTGSTT